MTGWRHPEASATRPFVSLVVAVARNGVIGAGGGLPWRISDDLKWFKQATMGKPILMGRKTWESIGAPLPGRASIVISRRAGFRAEGAEIVGSVGAALDAGHAAMRAANTHEVCVIGGGMIYAETIARADRIYLTAVDAEVDGDAYFTPLDFDDWRSVKVAGAEKSSRNEYSCDFFILDRRRGGAERR